MKFIQICKDIKSLKIQGANSIAKEACNAIRYIILSSKAKDSTSLYNEIINAKNILQKTRPTEPCMRNALNYIIKKEKNPYLKEYKEELLKYCIKAKKHIDDSNKIIAEYGSNKIKNGMIVFTHCHSSSVISILLEAKKQKKKFTVYNTETRPLFQGRKTAIELAKANIPVKHFVDSGARIALKNTDLMLIGCDAITIEGKIINKIGSELFAEVANKYDIPIYSCTNSWKFNPETIKGIEETIELRSKDEIWQTAPKGVEIINYAFEKINPKLITGIISELGIYPIEVFIEEINKKNNWMF
jgi:ribose 1,5-bisphosphate isomerase